MNTLKTVFEKLFKEETQLASHEVELALVDEFQKEINSGINLGDNLKKLVNINDKKLNDYFKLKQELQTTKNNLQSELQDIGRLISDIKAIKNRSDKSYTNIVNKASDLGFDYPKSIDAFKNELDNLVKYTDSIKVDNVKL